MENLIHRDQWHISAEPADAGLRLDAFLAKKLTHLSRAHLTKLIKAGQVTASGKGAKPSQAVRGDETFVIEIPDKVLGFILPEPIPLDIIFNDEHIAIINKPAGMVVHPGAGVKEGTLCNALLHHFPGMVMGNNERPGIVHRLDKETSGIMVVAKNQSSLQILSDAFKHRRVKKIYRAVCFGEVAQTKFELKTGHARHPYHRFKFLTKIHAPLLPSSNVRLAHSSFEIMGRAFGMSEVRVTLHTGRTHQIRAHLADIDHPLVGDELYGGKKTLPRSLPKELIDAVEQLSGQALHAESLEFNHPVTKELVSFTVPLAKPLSTISDFFRTIAL